MTVVIVACLFLHYTAAMTIFGAAAFRLLMAQEIATPIDRRLVGILKILFVVLAVSAVAMMLAGAAAMGGGWANAADPQVVGEVLLDTGFGKVWQWHLGLAVLTGAAIWLAPPQRPWIAVAALLLLASLAFVGHAAMVEGVPGDLRRLNQAIHLLAAGAWIGGLLPLVLTLLIRRAMPATEVLLRFSTYGTVAVAAVLVTGAINTVALVRSVGGLVDTPYGWTLLVKLALVAGLIGFALHNRFQLTPQLTAEPAAVARRLRRSVTLEIALGLGAVLAASLLGTLSPPQ